MKKIIFIAIFAFSVQSTFAQNPNPFKSIGKPAPEILSLSNGKYPEMFENDTLRKIGSVMFNTRTNKIEYFIETDTLYSEATLKPEIVSRWLSRDPLARKYPSHSPYNFVGNNPIIYVDSDGREIDLSDMTAEQITKYEAAIEVLSKSDIFSFYYQQLVESQTVYKITASGYTQKDGTETGGYYSPAKTTVGVGKSINEYVVAQELFHAYQDDGDFYEKGKESTIETEGDVATIYVMLQSELGFPSYGKWAEKIINEAYDAIPSSVEIGSEEYQTMFQNAVDERIKYYQEQGGDTPTYTKPNTGEKPKALKAAVKGSEDNKQENNTTEDEEK